MLRGPVGVAKMSHFLPIDIQDLSTKAGPVCRPFLLLVCVRHWHPIKMLNRQRTSTWRAKAPQTLYTLAVLDEPKTRSLSLGCDFGFGSGGDFGEAGVFGVSASRI